MPCAKAPHAMRCAPGSAQVPNGSTQFIDVSGIFAAVS
jgi:hypothetical protein